MSVLWCHEGHSTTCVIKLRNLRAVFTLPATLLFALSVTLRVQFIGLPSLSSFRLLLYEVSVSFLSSISFSSTTFAANLPRAGNLLPQFTLASSLILHLRSFTALQNSISFVMGSQRRALRFQSLGFFHVLLSVFSMLLGPSLAGQSSSGASPTELPQYSVPHSLPSTPSDRPPLLMISSIDGTVSAFNARTGTLLFSHHDSQPAVDSWAAPGMPEYVPSLDGLIYRIDRATDQAHVIDGRFVSHRSSIPSAVSTFAGREYADAVILTNEQTSVMYIDLRSGRVVAELKYDKEHPKDPTDPLLPKLSEHVVAVSRSLVGIRVVEADSGRELANASLVHTKPSFLDNGRCPSPPTQLKDKFVAYMTEARDRVTVINVETGNIAWMKEISSPVVEAHGLGGVRIVSSRREAELVGSHNQALLSVEHDHAPPSLPNGDISPHEIILTNSGKHVYATVATPHSLDLPSFDEETEQASQSFAKLRSEKKLRRFHVPRLPKPPSLESRDLLKGTGSLPLLKKQHKDPYGNMSYTITSRDLGLMLLILVVASAGGYLAGSRPRGRFSSKGKKRVKRRRRPGVSQENDLILDALSGEFSDLEKEEERGSDINEAEEERGLYPEAPSITTTEVTGVIGGGRATGETAVSLEVSNGSSGSGSGGYVPRRSLSGWMNVGCLLVSSKVLGIGSHGTIVYEGKMMPGERKVAVKRLLRQFFESARKEISLLVQLDEASPHVVRYFAMEEDSEFIYLALELCANTLAERVTERIVPVPPVKYKNGPPPACTLRALRQLLQGLADLHRVGVVHRDVKPQNVLITRSPSGAGDVKLADVGLALRLAANRSSYTAVTNAGGGVGTTGWRAPEVLGSGRQTKAVDIFAAGCIVCFVLTGGQHPFGNEIFGRDGNIAAGRPSLEPLEALKLPEATDIVRKMIDPVASNRPTASEALQHPFFWTNAMKLSFLVDISDRLFDLRYSPMRYTENLDRYALARATCSDWLIHMDMDLLMGLGRTYENTASGILRVIRNKRNHYSELPASLRARLGSLPEDKDSPDDLGKKGKQKDVANTTTTVDDIGTGDFLTYFTSRVPHLLMCVYKYSIENPALISQPHFERYGLKASTCREHLSLHPLVRRARAAAARLNAPSHLGEGEAKENSSLPNSEKYLNDLANEDYDADEDEVIVTTSSNRKAYHRHELVTMQALFKDMPLEVKKRALIADIYQPSAYARYKKRLTTNLFEESDFSPDELIPPAAVVEEVNMPTSVQNAIPKHSNQASHSAFGTRITNYATPPSTSRPPGLNAGPPGFNTGPPGFNAGPPGFNAGPPGYSAGPPAFNGGGNNNSGFRRGVTKPGGQTPTVSQFSGEERVVDFGSLRRRKQ